MQKKKRVEGITRNKKIDVKNVSKVIVVLKYRCNKHSENKEEGTTFFFLFLYKYFLMYLYSEKFGLLYFKKV